ncbi:MAG: hypothetical protein HYX40_06700 [Sphingobacteriales bacterium]|nr:hypothetical protein [Sphingobacteriales bacterium]
MKKLFMLAAAAFLISGVAFANGGGKKCKKECKKEASGKSCCKKSSDKKS